MRRELSLVALVLCTVFGFAQTGKPFTWDKKNAKDNVVMTWNKNTPEQEMKDDIKALGEYGVTIKYDHVKRNANNEITAIDVSFEDQNGHKGALNYNNSKPIVPIKIYKQGDEVGFGEPATSFDGNPFMSGFSGNDDILKEYNFNFDNDSLAPQKFEFRMPEGQPFGKTKSKITIKKDGKKPLVLEDGKVVEGGDDYTAEEIEEIKKNNTIKPFNNDDFYRFNFDSNGSLAEQMKKMQQQMDELMKQNYHPADKQKENKDLEESKKELENAKKELENAKKELQKAKSTLKSQKA